MRRFAVLATTMALFAAPAWAQGDAARDALDQVRLGFYDLGVLLVAPEPSFSSSTANLGAVRLQSDPKAQERWSISFEDVVLNVEEDGDIVALPKGAVFLRYQGLQGSGEWRIQATGLEARLEGQGGREEVGVWSITAPSIEVEDRDAKTRISAQGLRYEGGEKDRMYLGHRLRWDGATVRHHQEEGEFWLGGNLLELETAGIDLRLDLQSGGYLENQPWMAAVAAGMVADIALEAQGIVIGEGDSTSAGAQMMGRIEVDRVSTQAKHSREGLDANWTVTGAQWQDLGENSSRARLSNGQSRGSVRLPLHASKAMSPMDISVSAFGEFATAQKSWPWQARLEMGGTARLLGEWFDFNPISGTGLWRSLSPLIEVGSLAVRNVGLDVAAGGVKASGDLTGQSGGLVGAVDISSTGLAGLLDFIGHSGFFTSEQAGFAAEFAPALLGTTGPARITLDFTGNAVEMDGTPIWVK